MGRRHDIPPELIESSPDHPGSEQVTLLPSGAEPTPTQRHLDGANASVIGSDQVEVEPPSVPSGRQPSSPTVGGLGLPYTYANSGGLGGTAGAGLYRHRPSDLHPANWNLDVLHGQLLAGQGVDPDDGETVGLRARGGLIDGDVTVPTPLGDTTLSGGALTADAGVYANDDAATISLQAALLEGGAEGGAAGEHGGYGASEGPGGAVRFGYGDSDGDGLREIGPGLDVGPLSVNARSEVLHRAWNSASSTVGEWFDGTMRQQWRILNAE